jgi:hypothetical protein
MSNLKNSDPRIVATILAALRYFQANREDIITLELEHFMEDPPLSSDEIDELAEIHYCPYSQSYFSWKESGLPIGNTDLLVVIENKVYCSVGSHSPQLSLF